MLFHFLQYGKAENFLNLPSSGFFVLNEIFKSMYFLFHFTVSSEEDPREYHQYFA